MLECIVEEKITRFFAKKRTLSHTNEGIHKVLTWRISDKFWKSTPFLPSKPSEVPLQHSFNDTSFFRANSDP